MSDATIEDRAATFDGMAPAPETDRPGRPAMLSHVAYITRDTEATADFYTRVLGMELVNAVLDDAIPSTGEPIPYFHSFFRMGDGSTVAFFEAPELPPLEDAAPPGLRHVPAPRPPGRQPRRWSTAGTGGWWPAGSKCSAPSTTRSSTASTSTTLTGSGSRSPPPRRQPGTTMPSRPPPTWPTGPHVKRQARETGADMASVLHELARERSHRRS